MTRNKAYTAVNHEITIEARHYIEQYRDVARFAALCRECGNYERRWCCPPLDVALEARLRGYTRATLLACVITPDCVEQPLAGAMALMRPEIERLNRRVLELERERDGLAMGFAGSCYYCGNEPCTREHGLPCRHPERVRPSLEAYGFDLERTCRELLGIEMAWSRDPRRLPPRLTLLCAVFHH